ncbi:MAG: hypothetical protein P4L40_11060 [Terracidiphilus sp.]|nr:hypothetical protein [Terracidiphilus sp.]
MRRRCAGAARAVLVGALLAVGGLAQAQDELPNAPEPQPRPSASPGACQIRNVGATLAAAGAAQMAAVASGTAGASESQPVTAPCPIYVPMMNWYARFLDGPHVKALSPKQKAWLAIRNVGDPFNAVTILASSAISVGADSHSVYGPGMPGFGRLVGVSYAEDMTSEFFGTFLIPSLAHQDPHYHRAPGQSIPRRALHAATAVVWGQGDDGHGMLNYANLIGFGADIAISNLYVPGRGTNVPSSLARYGIGLALSPTDNLITEFLPDLARHIHFRVVAIQRIIDRVGRPEASASTP